MRKKITNLDINNIVKKVVYESNKDSELNEGWFSNLFGGSYSGYASKLEEIMQDLVNNVYYDQDLINEIRDLYDDIQNSNIDRRDKRELLETMYGMYQTLEMSKRKLESYIYRLKKIR